LLEEEEEEAHVAQEEKAGAWSSVSWEAAVASGSRVSEAEEVAAAWACSR